MADELKLGSGLKNNFTYGVPLGVEQKPEPNQMQGLMDTFNKLRKQYGNNVDVSVSSKVGTALGQSDFLKDEPAFKEPTNLTTPAALKNLANVQTGLKQPVYNPQSAVPSDAAQWLLAASSFFGGGQAAQGYIGGLKQQQEQLNQKAVFDYKAALDSNERQLESAKMNLQAAQSADKASWDAAVNSYKSALKKWEILNGLKLKLYEENAAKISLDYRKQHPTGGGAGKPKDDFYYAATTKDAFGTANAEILGQMKSEIDAKVELYAQNAIYKYMNPQKMKDWMDKNPNQPVPEDMSLFIDKDAYDKDVQSYKDNLYKDSLRSVIKGYKKNLDTKTVEQDIENNPLEVFDKVLGKTTVTEENKKERNLIKDAKAEAKVEGKINTQLAKAFDGYMKDLNSSNPAGKIGTVVNSNPIIRASSDKNVKARHLIRANNAQTILSDVNKITNGNALAKYNFGAYFDAMSKAKTSQELQKYSDGLRYVIEKSSFDDAKKQALLGIWEMVKY